MFLRPNRRLKDGKDHNYWSLVETVQHDRRAPAADAVLSGLAEYFGAGPLAKKRFEVFSEQGETQQLKLFPSEGGAAGG